MNVTKEQKIAVSIIIGFGLVAGAIFTTDFNIHANPVFASVLERLQVEIKPERTNLKERHLYGNPKAEITLVEFSDLECPYCSQLHTTLKRLVEESNETINWEYRHFPLSIHKNANISALYAECVSQKKDNYAFWKFVETLMKNQKDLTEAFARSTALSLVADETKLDACVEDQKIQDTINEDTKVAQSLGGSGTPFTVIVYKDGTTKSVSGALPYEQWLPLLKK